MSKKEKQKKNDKDEMSLNSLGTMPNGKLAKQVKNVMKEGNKEYKQVKQFVIDGNNAITELMKGKIALKKLAKHDSSVLPKDSQREFKSLIEEFDVKIDQIDKMLEDILDKA